ncbi:MAG: class 1 fructose-bisphosphatase, partial [Candidatus Riflebacteria bacterium]|nr:class 1 fructose-bisphosphatase [Candidatus Riflebacteria bacterium]
RIPARGKTYSVNESNYHFWDDCTRRYVDHIKESDPETGRPYSLRYVGSLVADLHRTLIQGGIFLYPADRRDPRKPTGKLRLQYEANPVALIVEQAGGLATDGHGRILELVPEQLHQRVPLVFGSPRDVEHYLDFTRRYEESDGKAGPAI